jgi:CxxC-x17-CxxC domain-containing protein
LGRFEMDGEKFKATCSDCGKECEVPFKPKEGRPVKCNDCFKKGRPNKGFGGGNRGGYNSGSRGGGNFNNRQRKDFDVVCSECGKKTTVPFKPTQGKPVKCRDCFRR